MHMVKTIWRWVRWPLLVLVIAYAALVAYRIPAVGEKQRTADTVAAIQAQKVTMADVMGTALPPVPYEPENDATVAGIDKNNNGIRDDVELAIFAKYPNSAKIRAAELQYAMALQTEMTQVFNSDTWKAAAIQDDRSYQCIGETYPRTDLQEFIKITDARSNEVEKLVYNTQMRKDAQYKVSTFTTSFGSPDTDFCDIDLNSLPN